MDQALVRKAVTLQDVASEVGVSKSTASYALTGNRRISDETREAVLQAAQRMGFEANSHAQNLSNGSARRTIGLFTIDLNLGVVILKIREIQSLLTHAGYEVPLYSYGSLDWGDATSHAALMRALRRQKPLAIVCFSNDLDDTCVAELERYHDDGGIVVSYDGPVDFDCDQVLFDRAENTYQAARHLVQLGHRKIGFFQSGGSDPRVGVRFQGLKRALGEAEIPVCNDWVWHGGHDGRGGAETAARFLRLKCRPTAVCLVNDSSAVAFVAAVQHAGLCVPEDISVVGHDNSEVGIYTTVPLTTVSHPVEAISRAAVDLLCSRLDGSYSGPARKSIVRGELIVRKSTGPLKGQ